LSPLSSNNNLHQADENNNDTAAAEEHPSEEIMEVIRNKTLVYSLFGRPYALHWNFWWQHLISSACLGALVGCLVGFFLWSHQLVAGILFPTRTHQGSRSEMNDNSSVSDHKGLGEWWWIFIAVGGALLASVVLELPRAPTSDTFRSLIYDLATLDGNFVESFHAVFSSWIALVTGLPIGTFWCCAFAQGPLQTFSPCSLIVGRSHRRGHGRGHHWKWMCQRYIRYI
jgi:hypothetical protein